MSVYFVECGWLGPIKIGYTANDVRERLSELQTSNPYDLTPLLLIDGDQSLERRLHHHFRASRMRGEWFRPSLDLLEFVIGVHFNTFETHARRHGVPFAWRDVEVKPGAMPTLVKHTTLREIIRDMRAEMAGLPGLFC